MVDADLGNSSDLRGQAARYLYTVRRGLLLLSSKSSKDIVHIIAGLATGLWVPWQEAAVLLFSRKLDVVRAAVAKGRLIATTHRCFSQPPSDLSLRV